MTRLHLIGPGMLLALAGPVRAECTGGNCYDGIVEFLISVAAYGLIGVVLLVMILVGKWRRAGLRGLGLVAVLAVGVPLLSQAWQRVQLWQMERQEVLGQPPVMSARAPLLIAPDWTCEAGVCAAVLSGQDAAGVTALPMDALEGRDMAAPLRLADLPLENWSVQSGVLRRRLLTEAERRVAADRIDYLILSTSPTFRDGPGPLEAGAGLGQGVLMRLGMAPLKAGQAEVALHGLDYDILDLVLTRAALGIPLAPGNWTVLWNDALAPEVVARSLCATGVAEPDWFCLDATGR